MSFTLSFHLRLKHLVQSSFCAYKNFILFMTFDWLPLFSQGETSSPPFPSTTLFYPIRLWPMGKTLFLPRSHPIKGKGVVSPSLMGRSTPLLSALTFPPSTKDLPTNSFLNYTAIRKSHPVTRVVTGWWIVPYL